MLKNMEASMVSALVTIDETITQGMYAFRKALHIANVLSRGSQTNPSS